MENIIDKLNRDVRNAAATLRDFNLACEIEQWQQKFSH